MSEDKYMTLEACRYDDLAKYTKVFNADESDYHLWIYLNPQDVRGCSFVEAKEIGPNANNATIFPDTFVRKSQCWIRVNKPWVGTSPGKHTIKLTFVDPKTDDDFSLYVSFYMQVDNPDKPYVYMEDKSETFWRNQLRPEIIDNGFTVYDSEATP